LIELEIIGEAQPAESQPPVIATCACGSGIPVQNIIIAGKEETLAGLPLIFQQFAQAGKFPSDETLSELIDTVKIYNPIPTELESNYREAIGSAYRKFWFKDKAR
jgi:hypothetical protein